MSKLQLKTNQIDICRTSKILVRHNVKASISLSEITLDGDISDEVIAQICGDMDIKSIKSVQNFFGEEPSYVSNEALDPHKKISMEYDLRYPEVKYGEVYICNFGEPYLHEQGYPRYAIIVQNDIGNVVAHTTVVVPCTTSKRKSLHTHVNTFFSDENMYDYDIERVGPLENIIKTEQIRTVDKCRLRKYIGRLKPEFMKTIGEKIDGLLKISEKFSDEMRIETQPERKDVVKEQLLSLVDAEKMKEISQKSKDDETKVNEILGLFGFDFKRKGVSLLAKAIIISTNDDYFNLETLSEVVSQEEMIDKEEVKRLMIARVKETMGFTKAPTIDFIRLVNTFLTTGGLN